MANPNWKPGVSGNPSGLSAEQRERLADARHQALEVLMEKGSTGETKDRELWAWGLNHPDPDIRVKVWFRAQDYAFGTPQMNVHHSGEVATNIVQVPPTLDGETWQAKAQAQLTTN